MFFPLLFSIGMALLDTLDGILMLWAYSWADFDPIKRICFNLYLTVSTVVIALAVGFVEVLGCIQQELDLHGGFLGFWDVVHSINDHFQFVGFLIIVFFLLSSVIT